MLMEAAFMPAPHLWLCTSGTVAGPYGPSTQSTEALQLTAWVGSRHVIQDLIYEAYSAFQVVLTP